jgi:hypothetical protein
MTYDEEKIDEYSNRELKRILQYESKCINEAENLLTYLFRRILIDLMITEQKWNQLMKNYLDNPHHRISKSGIKRSSARGNLNKQLIKNDMTIKNFERGLRLLNPRRIIFKLILNFSDDLSEHWVGYEGNKVLNYPISEKMFTNQVVEKATGILSMLFRKTLQDLNIRHHNYSRLLNQYVNRFYKNEEKRRRNNIKNNVRKELEKKDLTFNNFINGLKFLNPDSAKLEVLLLWENNETVHWIDLPL